MFNKNKYCVWQIANKEHIVRVYNMVVSELERNNLDINEKKSLYSDIVYFLYINQE